jgi:hypothetical protein
MEIASLADLVHETSQRHGAFEALAPPHDWWDRYAAYMDSRQGESSPDEVSAAARRYMAEAKGIAVARDRGNDGSSTDYDLVGGGKGLLRDCLLDQLARQRDVARERTVEIAFLEPGAEAYSFTFG